MRPLPVRQSRSRRERRRTAGVPERDRSPPWTLSSRSHRASTVYSVERQHRGGAFPAVGGEMEQRDGLRHECPACAGASESPGGDLSRRSLLRLGLAAGVGAATVRISPAFAAPVGEAEHEVGAPGAALVPSARPQQPSYPPPPIVTRAQWGANEGLRKSAPSYNTVVEKIVVHHTVTPNNPPDPAATVRSVYEYNMSGEYLDIAYHFLIDQNGRIYEGRWARLSGRRTTPARTPSTRTCRARRRSVTTRARSRSRCWAPSPTSCRRPRR